MMTTHLKDTAPVCLFVYNRIDTLKNTVASLLENKLAQQTDVYIFSDAARSENEKENVRQVRLFISDVKGFKSVTVLLSERNNGLAKSIINGVSSIIKLKGKVIVLEDDLVVAPNFLDFMNAALDKYQFNQKIFSASGYSSPIKFKINCDVYFSKRASSWGWATWSDRWEKIDWNVSDFGQFNKDKKLQSRFNKMGSDLTHMLKKQMAGKINSWAIRWVYHQFKNDLYSVFPSVSKVVNDGFHSVGTHTSENNRTRFSTQLDTSGKGDFDFYEEPFLDPKIIKQFVAPYTIKTRVIYKLKGLLHF